MIVLAVAAVEGGLAVDEHASAAVVVGDVVVVVPPLRVLEVSVEPRDLG